MAGNFLNVGVSGLLSNQAALNTVSHNIANANTEGYSRQVTEIDTRLPQFLGGNYVGTGAQVDAIKRVFNSSVANELTANTSVFNQLETYLDQASRVDSMVADASTGLNQALQNFFSAVQTVSNDPTSIASRQVMLSQGELLSDRFKTLTEQFDTQTRSLNLALETSAEEISALGQSIADINVKIAAASGGGQGTPNDLLDERERLINDLAELVDVKPLRLDDGTMSIFIGSGQALVVGATANKISAVPRPNDPKNMSLVLQTGSASIPITESIKGGKMGGLLRFREEILEPAYNVLGRVALAVSDSVNSQSQLGMDLNNQLGSNFFNDINDIAAMQRRVVAGSGNTGTASIAVQIDDVNALGNDNYQLSLQGGTYTLTNQTTNSVVASFAPPGATPTTVAVPSEGISIVFEAGAAANGDEFSLFPTRNGAAEIGMNITNPSQIAAALPVAANENQSNIGTGNVSSVTVSDTTTPQFTNVPGDLDPPLIFEFVGPNSFNVRDANTNAVITGPVGGYVPNQQNDMMALAGLNHGYEVTLNGAPQSGDTFNISYNTNGFGDNRNSLLIGDLQQQDTLDNGTSNFQEAFGRLVSDVGTRTQESRINLSASESILNQVKERRESISGVNLDEEAAKLIKFEQAYQASAQIIQVARTLFQTVLDSTR
ncbi:flagellar hook-associated protein FlgK [Pleionea mediterranea]|uniref:Flagellar hook-associated protein 1 n=1 Tax=Pleionea mediterranea TaxID=523701 RepID=A0A316FJR7_9GAMM|nr:flagellar hook-associated protein FlgK [Pleionea mediterranea]PWK49181.1 flagellar hook-associated protein 1 FlgK [Pleionea mediterranea]